jgi:diguanylate cyclase (GGDEF)-like protein/PAS domain S-box-containing protein
MRISSATRIAFGLALMAVCVVSGAIALGLVESRSNSTSRVRLRSAETLAMQFSAAMTTGDGKLDARLIDRLVAATEGLSSIGLRRADDRLMAASPEHGTLWAAKRAGQIDANRAVEVPLFRGDEKWGSLELIYKSAVAPSLLSDWQALAFVGAVSLIAFLLYMRRTLRVLDPSNVVPERVKAMLNTIGEGAVIIDGRGDIMLANSSFARLTNGTDSSALVGRKVSEFKWRLTDGATELPWVPALRGETLRATTLEIDTHGTTRSLQANASPVLGANREVRGALVTLSDVTEMRQQNRELQLAQDRVERQNEQLKRLATRDALTGCLNRRAFHEQLELMVALAHRHGHPLSAIMLDIDHFKSINDRFGHAVGDEVLQVIANRLQESLRATDVLCRYGGEEFCVLLPHTAEAGAAEVAEKLRQTIEATPVSSVVVTSSFGVASAMFQDPQESLPQDHVMSFVRRADAALYHSKRSGRNRVTVASMLSDDAPTKAATGEASLQTLERSLRELIDTVDSAHREPIRQHAEAIGQLARAVSADDRSTPAN